MLPLSSALQYVYSASSTQQGHDYRTAHIDDRGDDKTAAETLGRVLNFLGVSPTSQGVSPAAVGIEEWHLPLQVEDAPPINTAKVPYLLNLDRPTQFNLERPLKESHLLLWRPQPIAPVAVTAVKLQVVSGFCHNDAASDRHVCMHSICI